MKKSNKPAAITLRQKAEEQLKMKPSKISAQYSEVDTLKLIHELQVHQIELELQNEELMLAKEREAAAATDKYAELYDFAPSGYFTLSQKGEIVELNIIGSQMLGKERLYLKNKLFDFFVSHDKKPTFNQFLQKVFESKTKQSCEIALIVNANLFVHIFLSGIIDKNEEQCLLTAIDITDRKKAELELKESEELFALASKAAGFGSFSYSFESGNAFYSEEFLNLYELSAGETIELDSDRVAKALHPDDKSRFLVEMQKANDPRGSGILDIEFRIVLKGGGIRWLRSRGLTNFTGNKPSDRPIQANGIVQDITEQKNAELELAKQNSALTKLNLFSIELTNQSNNDDIEVFIAKQLKEIAGAEFAVFSDFDSSKRTTTVKHIEIESKLLSKVVKILGKQILKLQSVVSDEVYHEMTTDTVGSRKTLHEIGSGSIPVTVGSAIQTLLNVDRFFGLAYLVDGELYGTSIIGMKKGQPDPKKEILENFVSIASVSLRRIKVDKALRESDEIFTQFMKNSPIYMFFKDENIRPIRLSDNYEKMLGRPINELLGKNMNELFPSELSKSILADDMRILAKGEQFVIDEELNGRYYTTYKFPIKIEGKQRYLAGFTIDITERKQMEDALLESEVRFRTLFEQAAVGVALLETKTGRYIQINQKYCDILGYTIDEMLQKTFHDVTYLGDIQANIDNNTSLVDGTITEYSIEKRYIHKNGKLIWGKLTVSPLWKTGTQPDSFSHIAVVEDITERKQAEHELRESEANLEEAQRIARIGSWERDLISNTVKRSKEFYRVFDMNPEIFEKRPEALLESIHPDDIDLFTNNMNTLLSGLNTPSYEYRIFHQDGSIHNILANSIITFNDAGNPLKIHGTVQDITERKKVMEVLMKQEMLLSTVLKKLPVGVWITDANGTIISGNEAGEKIWAGNKDLGIGQYSELKGWWADTGKRIEPKEWPSARALTWGETSLEEEIIIECFDGTRKTILNSALPLRDTYQQITGAIIIDQDITERKQVDYALRESEERYRSLFENNSAAMAIIEQDTTISMVNEEYCRMSGYTLQEVVGTSWTQQITPEDIVRLKEFNRRRLINPNDAPAKYEFSFYTKNGEIKQALMSVAMIQNKKIITSFIDITERKEAEEALRLEKENFGYSMDNSPLGVRIVSAEGKTIYANRAILGIYGYKSLKELQNTPLKKRYTLKSYTEAQKRKQQRKRGDLRTSNYEISIVRENGEIRQLQVFRKVVLWDGIEQFQVIYNDITQHKQAEEEILRMKESLQNLNQHLDEVREKERAIISREIHDQLGQSLTALKIDMNWLRNKIASDSDEGAKLKGMIELITDTSKDVQRISTELRPAILDDLGLAATLDWYCEEFAKRTGLQLHMELDEVQTENISSNLAIFRVLQESLTNIIRHANAKNVLVKLCKIKKEIVLLVQDDGIGIPPDKIKSFKSIGLLGMFERVRQTGGNMVITTPVTGGTSIRVNIPI